MIKTNVHLSRHTVLLCEMLTSLLIMGFQMGEMSKLGWLIELIEETASLHFRNYNNIAVYKHFVI
jgi:hypothetical protein